MIEEIETATGKKFKVDLVSLIPYPEILYIRIIEGSFSEIATVFSDKEETSLIIYNGIEITGFTNLGYIMREGDALKVRLSKNG